MATVIPKSLLQISNPFPYSLKFNSPPPPIRIRIRIPSKPHRPQAARDDDDDSNPSSTDESSAPPADSSFENRLAQVRLKYRSGTGKKAELRRAKKGGGGGAGKKKGGGGGGLMLPPVALREPVSAGGMAVDFGFTPYTEWLNGRLAGLGLAALLLVELGSGKGLLKYHSAPIVFLQVYTVAAAGAVFVKYEKERISVWPEKKTPAAATSVAEEAGGPRD